VAQLLALPASGFAARFGPEATALYELARGERFAPLQPVRPPEADRARCDLEPPETDAWRLMFAIKRLLNPLLGRLGDRQQAVARLHLDFVLAEGASAGGNRLRETLRPAAPTVDIVLLMELVRLRLETVTLAGGVAQVTLEVVPVAAVVVAPGLFQERPRRDLRAALRAIARLRAEFGDHAVVRAQLRSGHWPEASFRWTATRDLAFATVAAPPRRRPLIRRLLTLPRPLAGGGRPGSASDHRPDLSSAALRQHGPYFLSGRWWQDEIRRAYHFVEDRRGALLWIYYDQQRGAWYLQGRVE
jgi:protein ImuB